MDLIKKTHQYRRDFDGIVKCQFCGHEEELHNGYDDHFYHTQVIPNLMCSKCHKSTISENDTIQKVTLKYPEDIQL